MKCDTSSDELDGHYFFYAVYYDLVADTPEEKARVRQVVGDITTHLIEHDYQLVDWDGQPTRWAIFGPDQLNHNPDWFEERGLNSLSMLSYLRTAEHVTGDKKYAEHYDKLVKEHSYAINSLFPKMHLGPGIGNHSDDEMAFMGFYNIMNYEKDATLRGLYAQSLYRYWLLERPEKNPFFNYVFLSAAADEEYPEIGGRRVPNLLPETLAESADTLVRFPVDRIMWGHENSHRQDIVALHGRSHRNGRVYSGKTRDGYVLPMDERSMEYWNHNPWELDRRSGGEYLADGSAYLLPYYMGLYYGYIKEGPKE